MVAQDPTKNNKSNQYHSPHNQSPIHLSQQSYELSQQDDQSGVSQIQQSQDEYIEDQRSYQQHHPRVKKYHIGEQIDCMFKQNQNCWLNGEIIAVRQDYVRIHYSGLNQKYDEWIHVNSSQLQKQWKKGQQLQRNNRIDIKINDEWQEVTIVEIDEQNEIIQVRFPNQQSQINSKQLLFFQYNTENIAEVGTYSKAFGTARYQQKKQNLQQQNNYEIKNDINSNERNNLNINSGLLKQIQQQEMNFEQELRKKNFYIKRVAGDGNCLFRAVGDQIYGDENYHQQIRNYCMDYISIERDFFKNFIIDGDDQFDAYIERKRQDTVWGDDVEIQALSEIYQRGVEIYAYSNQPMRTFHEKEIMQNEPIRLSYHGKSHYNSIKRITNNPNNYLNTNNYEFGFLEQHAIQKALQRVQKNKVQQDQQNNEEQQKSLEEDIIDDAVKSSRLEFENKGIRDMELALDESLRLYQEQTYINEEQIIKQSLDQYEKQESEQQMINMALRDANTNETEEIMMKQILEQSKKDLKDEDQIQNWAIQQVVNAGFSLEQAIQAHEIMGNDPDAMISLICENLQYQI